MAIERIGEGMVSLDLIKSGPFQARQNSVDAGMDELCSSIRIQGLFKPVMLVEVEEGARYELIDGRRRFLAFVILRKEDPERFSKIPCFLYRDAMERWERKSVSFMANMTSEPMDKYDKINSVSIIYKHFDSIRRTVLATGMSESTVRRYVRAARLPDEILAEIEAGNITMTVALEAADLFGYDRGNPTGVDIGGMVWAARSMQKLNKTQKGYVKEIRKTEPHRQMRDIVDEVVSLGIPTRGISISVVGDTYDRIEMYRASGEVSTVPKAAVELVEDGLKANDM